MSENNKYREQLEPLIDNWNAEFDKLEAQMRKAGVNPEDDYDEVISALRQHRIRSQNYRIR